MSPAQGHFGLQGAGPDGDIVVAARVRLARNLAGHRFVHRADTPERLDILEAGRSAALEALGPGARWLRVDRLPMVERLRLMEARLVSRAFAARQDDPPRGLAMDADAVAGLPGVSVMVNEEDHLRLQAVRQGGDLLGAFEAVERLDDALAARLDLAFSRRFGFLTACPTNLGTGIRVSVMLHLPALVFGGGILQLKAATRDMGLALRGMYGEGSGPLGDLFQVSNQVTLGRPERLILQDFAGQVVPAVVAFERRARAELMQRRREELEDHVHRAAGVLRGARLLPTIEAIGLLSRLRLGLALGLWQGADDATLAGLMARCQPGHLQLEAGRRLNAHERRRVRADLVRAALGG